MGKGTETVHQDFHLAINLSNARGLARSAFGSCRSWHSSPQRSRKHPVDSDLMMCIYLVHYLAFFLSCHPPFKTLAVVRGLMLRIPIDASLVPEPPALSLGEPLV
jgi:hypothetical protein